VAKFPPEKSVRSLRVIQALSANSSSQAEVRAFPAPTAEEALMLVIFTVHSTPATAKELESLCRVTMTTLVLLAHTLMAPLNRWIPDNVSVTLCSVPPVGQKQSATCLANTTAIQELFNRSLSQVCIIVKSHH
jgi:hypothetical protein